jgi:hypothetical protein
LHLLLHLRFLAGRVVRLGVTAHINQYQEMINRPIESRSIINQIM